MLLQTRQSLPATEWRAKSDRLCHQLQSVSIFATARTILAYSSFRQEPDLSLLLAQHYCWGLPRCVGKALVWHQFQPGDLLQTGAYGIVEPLPDAPEITTAAVDLILVPAVACDRQGYRLGYGGGYYDRLLSSPEWAAKPAIGIVFDFAYLPQLPVDPWDKPLQAICTETGWHSFSL